LVFDRLTQAETVKLLLVSTTGTLLAASCCGVTESACGPTTPVVQEAPP
jgi:hypothetical protein